jgi:hypothetical protein
LLQFLTDTCNAAGCDPFDLEAHVVRDFLWSTATTVAAIGIPTLLHWIWTGRTRPLSYSYDRTLLYLLRWFGTAYALVAGMLLVIASADLLFGRGLGYQVWAPLLCTGMIMVGLIVRWLAGLWLERQRR